MDNPTIQTDLAQILNRLENKIDKLDEKIDGKIDKLDEKIDGKIDKLDEKIDKLSLGQVEIKGDIKALDVKTDQLNTRVGNVEFAVRGILIGIAVIVFGGFAMFFWMSTKLP
ncbi:MAG: polyhedral envelope protein [Waterburya sp.]